MQTIVNEAKAWFGGLLHHTARKYIRSVSTVLEAHMGPVHDRTMVIYQRYDHI